MAPSKVEGHLCPEPQAKGVSPQGDVNKFYSSADGADFRRLKIPFSILTSPFFPHSPFVRFVVKLLEFSLPLRLCVSALKTLQRLFTAGKKPPAHTKASSQTVRIAGERNGRSPSEWQTVAAVPTKTATSSGGR